MADAATPPPADENHAAVKAGVAKAAAPTLDLGPSTLDPGLSRVYILLAVLWLSGAIILLIRLAAAHAVMIAARRSARPASAEVRAVCEAIAAALRARPPAVLHSPRFASPCLAGWWRPAILLPAETQLVSREVLVHELAHLVRGDCLWNFLGRAATAVLWFQPLVHWLARRVEQAADDVCDDYVIAQGLDRADYAHELLDVAERFSAGWPLTTAGVGIISLRSSLGRRVLRILDTSRSLSTRAGRTALAAILFAGASATLLAAWLGMSGGQAGGVEPQKSTAEKKEPAKPAAEMVLLRGRVLDPKGAPLPKATLYLSRASGDTTKTEQLGVSGADGRFEVRVDRSLLDGKDAREPIRSAALVATAEGFGCQWLDALKTNDGGELTIQLVDDKPIEGRILSLEGRPVVGASVRVKTISVPSGDLDEYVEAVRSSKYYQFDRLLSGLPGLSEGVETDEQGRFTIRGLGDGRVVELAVEGPGMARANIRVMTRDAETVTPSNIVQQLVPPRLHSTVSCPHPIDSTLPLGSAARS